MERQHQTSHMLHFPVVIQMECSVHTVVREEGNEEEVRFALHIKPLRSSSRYAFEESEVVLTDHFHCVSSLRNSYSLDGRKVIRAKETPRVSWIPPLQNLRRETRRGIEDNLTHLVRYFVCGSLGNASLGWATGSKQVFGKLH